MHVLIAKGMVTTFLLLVYILPVSCRQEQEEADQRGKTARLTIVSTVQDLSALLYVAEEQGYFAAENLEVDIVDTPSGGISGKILLDGDADLAMMSDFAFVNLDLEHDSLVIVASLAEADNTELVARRDRGIDTPADLAGKRIGLSMGNSPEFYLGTFLTAHGLTFADIQPVDLAPDRFTVSVTEGEVDALAAWPPHTLSALTILGDKGIRWSLQEEQNKFWLMVGREDSLPARETIRRLLFSLARAEEFIAVSPGRLRDILRNRLGVGDAYLDYYLPRNRFRLGLSSELLAGLELASRWMLYQQGEENKVEMPNYLTKIYFRGLDEVRPEAVTIIH